MLCSNVKYIQLLAIIGSICSCSSHELDEIDKYPSRHDSLSVQTVSTYLADHYDRPIAVEAASLHQLLESEGDSFLIMDGLLDRTWNKTAYRYDSVLAITAGLLPHPPYNPASTQLDTTQLGVERFTLMVDMGVYGNTKIMRYEINGSKGSYYAARVLVSVNPDCSKALPPAVMTSECVTPISNERIEIDRKQYEHIRDYYYGADLDRTTYYEHHGRMICDGYVYHLRHRFASEDKALSIPCPRPDNPVVILCERMDSLFDKQLHTPLI